MQWTEIHAGFGAGSTRGDSGRPKAKLSLPRRHLHVARLDSTLAHMPSKSHGMSSSPEYRVWCDMRRRCRDGRYQGYGIKVCKRWESFEAFLKDVGRRPSSRHWLDRINNDRGYSPGNCRWALPVEQLNNRSNNRFLRAFGERHTTSEWSRLMGVPVKTIHMRKERGWSDVEAISVPVHRKKKRRS